MGRKRMRSFAKAEEEAESVKQHAAQEAAATRPRPIPDSLVQKKRQGGWLGRPDVEEMDGLAIDLGREPRELVQESFVLAPVVGGAPVLDQALRVITGHSLLQPPASGSSASGRG
jgi:hypothetical protein